MLSTQPPPSGAALPSAGGTAHSEASTLFDGVAFDSPDDGCGLGEDEVGAEEDDDGSGGGSDPVWDDGGGGAAAAVDDDVTEAAFMESSLVCVHLELVEQDDPPAVPQPPEEEGRSTEVEVFRGLEEQDKVLSPVAAR